MDGGAFRIRLFELSATDYLVQLVCLCYLFILLQKFVEPAKIQKWAVVNFSARCDVRGLIRDLTRLAEMKGLVSLISCLLQHLP